MRFLSLSAARERSFDCERWSRLESTASWSDTSDDRFVHDSYSVRFVGNFETARDALLAYRIFPPNRMFPKVSTPDATVALGATIIQRIVLGPLAIETAVRVINVQISSDRASFAYATVRGHPEHGIASFGLTRQGDKVEFEAQAWSRSGTWLTRLGRPVSRWLQKALTRQAVAFFAGSAGQ